ncbi:hypothetical protein C5167_033615 [Papaver somniferum]|uniref:Lysine-specific demethylase ELF6 n=1 Tax=Papaver somniferum TaxID=3469 RepID=A0A4Y7KCC4_PAPSO|nr:probable lysine-specific demethylase ELF6 [Papaver somniferum]RZC70486.1 hypothetical protein C5167_033615 [Papaver somniferum]
MSGVEIPNWLKKLPLAPEFYPTDTEFADPIAYISKIEKEASAFGICKVIPPLPKPSKKYTYSNLNKSLSKFPDLGSDFNSALASSCSGSSSGDKNGDVKPVFTTRHQELGCSSKRSKGSVRQSAIHKQVWQSGEVYTLEQFETKSKVFAKNQLGTVKDVIPLTVETLFWKASCEKPIYVEYANDVPGSGFGEPDFPNRYFHKQRSKRKFSRNHRRNFGCEKREIDTERNSNIGKDSASYMKIDSDPSSEACKHSPSSVSMLSDECQRLSKSRSSDAVSDREGSAGWKLSNCPWNLQVIARSPGSLTRFMLEDIPGVTSPMIYIGMLYSWFAWHVEDHELHSLNYLHTGSPKTWYAVPGDRADAFEETVCSQGYGGNIDRLAALTLLGEKTNLLSPEVVVASGLPCCRLVQYPGEFVVTFPRAYHVGFSHGFNCGEAANFGTPQWLKVAKEAAVRRAAMDLLPMLSHQQLLYMLTMSFISRVPSALLLPGARSSRLRDRQKEERELLVKKAFIDDMVSESNLLLAFLGKESTSYVVTWDSELLPSTIKDSGSSPSPSTFSESCLMVDGERDLDTHNLVDENIVGSCDSPVGRTELSMETGEGLYENDNELPCGLHVDPGALACVACGILGFPFMSIVQPSHCASEKLLCLADSQMVQEGQELLRSVKLPFPIDLNHSIYNPSDTQGEENQKELVSLKHNDHILMDIADHGRNFRSVDIDQDTKGPPMHPRDNLDKQWSRVSGFLRPRIFCLEHGLEIEELLQSKGGADVLIICHSAYQKIKAHASAVAEEIGVSFNCKEVPLQSASQEDLKLINIAIDSEEHEEGGEDWTSRMGINLQYRVKLKKLYPSKQDNYALVLRGLPPDKSPNLDMSSLKWNSKKIRTPVMTTGLIHYKSCGDIQIKEVKQVEISVRNKVIIDSGPIRSKSGKNLQVKEDISFHISETDKVTVATSPNLSELCANKHFKEDKAMISSERFSVSGETSVGQCDSCDNSLTKEEKPVEILETGSNIQAKNSREYKLGDNTQIEEDQSVEESERSKAFRENTIILYSRRARNQKMGFASQPNSWANVRPRSKTDTPKESSAANETLDNKRIQSDGNLGDTGNSTVYGMELVKFPVMENCKLKSRDFTTTEISDISEASDPSKFTGSLIVEDVSIQLSGAQLDVASITEDNRCVCKAPGDSRSSDIQGTAILTNKSIETPSKNRNLEETDFEDKDFNCTVMDLSEIQQEAKTVAIESNLPMVMDIPETQHEGKTSADKSVVCNDACSTVEQKGPECAATKNSEMQLEAETSSPEPMVRHQAKTMTKEKGSEDVIMDSLAVQHEDKINESNQPSSLVMLNPEHCHEDKVLTKESATRNQANPFRQPKISVSVNGSSEVLQDIQDVDEAGVGCSTREDMDSENTHPKAADTEPAKREGNKRSRELDQITKDQISFDGFIRGPCEGLRPRSSRTTAVYQTNSDISVPEEVVLKKSRTQVDNVITHSGKNEVVKEAFACNIERCRMRFMTKTQLVVHKQNQCTHKGCGKRFSSHKNVILHQRVHAEERPLKCSWEGCSMSFKWAWARTEHLRLHTGERPYECKVSGCGLTFRFVSDYSRHRRKTGHYVNSPP